MNKQNRIIYLFFLMVPSMVAGITCVLKFFYSVKIKLIIRVAVLILSILSLSGCINLASSGASAIYNRHSLQKSWGDQFITLDAYKVLYQRTRVFDNTHITVSTFNGEILLTGQSPTIWQKEKAAKLLQHLRGVSSVHNCITVIGNASAITSASDAWITSKIKAKFVAANEIDATQIKVVTENGVVYLMGTIPHDEADVAIDIARNTDGVLSVVKVFSYIYISKT